MLSFCMVAVIIFLGAFAYKIEHVQKERDVWKQERKNCMMVYPSAILCGIQAGK